MLEVSQPSPHLTLKIDPNSASVYEGLFDYCSYRDEFDARTSLNGRGHMLVFWSIVIWPCYTKWED
jgi:hypothetical protein